MVSTRSATGGRRATAAWDWAGTACRLLLAGVWMYAGIAKVTDLSGSVRAVKAYQILPAAAAEVIGAALPLLELSVGVLLLVGVAVRFSAVVSTLLLVAFLVGVASAWARGLRIDCGCFGGGGDLGGSRSPRYLQEIARDAALLAAAMFLVIRPHTRFGVDGLLGVKDCRKD